MNAPEILYLYRFQRGAGIAEQHVKAAAETLRQGRTSIVIAHRLSTIENADRIIVMKAGEIIETGTHTELLSSSGKYADIYHAQFS